MSDVENLTADLADEPQVRDLDDHKIRAIGDDIIAARLQGAHRDVGLHKLSDAEAQRVVTYIEARTAAITSKGPQQ